MRKAIAVSTLLFVAFTAQADDGWYAGANVVQVKYKENGIPEATSTALAFRVGKEINPYLALEGRVGTGLSDDTVRVSGIDIALDVDSFYGVYARGMIPTGHTFRPYGLIGYTHGKLTGSASGLSITADDSDFSYGVGADFAISKQIAINAEYAQLFKGDDFKVNALSIGVAFKF